MPAIFVVQKNGSRWIATHCEVVIPVGGTREMSPAAASKAIAYCEDLSKRLASYNRSSGFWREYFDSVEEFERYEANPDLARAEQPAVAARRARPGVIYLAKGKDSYKIGRSSSFAHREHHLTLKLPFPVEVVHKIQAADSVAAERFWHGRFAALRVRGEWFNLGAEQVAEFCGFSQM